MSAEKPETPLCEQFGFDAEWRQAQLLLVGLDACPDDQVRQLHEQVLAHEVVEQVVERFFAQLMRHAQAAELLSSFDLDHLKERQVAYFDVFGVNCRSAEYFESRALMGIAHARVGVPLSLYLSAFGLLQALLLDAIVERLGDEAGRQALAGLRKSLGPGAAEAVQASAAANRAASPPGSRSAPRNSRTTGCGSRG